jgi:hypothetical protein
MRHRLIGQIVLHGIILSLPLSASAGQSERWSCKGDDPPGYTGDWTIAENRMFAVKGKGAYALISNSPSVAVAYELHQSGKKAPVISYVIVLDKAGGQMIQFDDIVAGAMSDASIEPHVLKWACRRVD